MEISIVDAQFNTLVFSIIFWTVVLFSIRKQPTENFFATFRTQEMKGFAILAIIFSHIGYFLVSDEKFLWPMSILAGVGVNLFLFLSGMGLTLSSLQLPLTVFKFYYRRLKKLFVPLWITAIILFAMDYFVLERIYPVKEILQTFGGYFPVADLFDNLNSPLWYFSLIFFYYLIFPLTFFKKIPYLSPLLILGVSYYFLKIEMPFEINKDVLNLYKTHFAAFPLGVLTAILISDDRLSHIKLKVKGIFLTGNLKYLLVLIFAGMFGYFSINSGVGESKNIEQTISLITMFSIIFLFVMKNFEIRLFTVFGIYSYEIYLIHWPILSRYDFLYRTLPAWLATILYLSLFLGISYLLHRLTKLLRV